MILFLFKIQEIPAIGSHSYKQGFFYWESSRMI